MLLMTQKERVPFYVANKHFYDVPERLDDDESKFEATQRAVPTGWKKGSHGLTVALSPNTPEFKLPDQGWKIHVSATPSNASDVVEVVWNYCLSNGIAFKFLRSRQAVVVVNSKYWSRGASGKCVTIYPRNESELAHTLEGLAPMLSQFKGPYILSDLRYGDGPLFVRYGAFTAIWYTHNDGRRSPAFLSPDGTPIIDHRNPVFSIPNFVAMPKILEPHVDDTSGGLEAFPFEFETALHFSNGGGVYLGRLRDSEQRVVIREARPHAGLDALGKDAVARLSSERSVLSKLQSVPHVPRLIKYQTVWEHDFLVEEYIEGATLLDEIILRYPLVHVGSTKAELEEYMEWAQEISNRLEQAVKDIHARGVCIGDLHPSNILVLTNGDVKIVDFECATEITDASFKSSLGAPGFAPQTPMTATDADFHALRNIRLMLLLPLVPLISLQKEKRKTLVRVACELFPMSLEFKQGIEIESRSEEEDRAAARFASIASDWTRVRDSIVQGIEAAASAGRSDRLFPGDPFQFAFGGATLAYGAAGVLLAIHLSKGRVPSFAADWLVDRSLNADVSFGAGMYDGLHGIAYTLDSIGQTDAALQVFNKAMSEALPAGMGMFGGLAGIALNLLHFRKITGDDTHFSTAVGITEDLLNRLNREPMDDSTFSPGLMQGATGPALLFLHMYEETGDEQYLNAAEQALWIDLIHGTTLPDGAFHIRLGSRHLVYLDGGSAGIGLVILHYLRHRRDPPLTAILSGICRACQIPFALQAGLFQGKASQVALLSQARIEDVERSVLLEQVERFAWYAVLHDENICFPGSGLTRLSCDLATGSAGVLLVLRSVFEETSLGLPFL
jgi:hypothetical protein